MPERQGGSVWSVPENGSGMSSSFLEVPSPAAKGTESEILPLLDPRQSGVIRAELLGMEGLESQARRLAAACTLGARQRINSPLLKRFHDNQRLLLQARREIFQHERIELQGIDAEWLADNFHIVDDVLREVRQDLPRGYDVILPKLGGAPLAGYPRVYALAVTLIAHTDSELDEPRIGRFVQAFQENVPLTIGELWALPTMFRLVLLENLRRLAEQMLGRWQEWARADAWFQQAMAVVGSAGAGAERAGADVDSGLPPVTAPSGPFVVRLVQLLRDQGPTAVPLLRRLEAALDALGRDSDEVLGEEHHLQAVNQITVGNCVLSLRLLSAVDWNAFFERTSLVETILREDPSGIYPLQDFATSDRYRKVVEKIARGSKADELAVARRAIELARAGGAVSAARGHVGYYLVSRGEAELRQAFGYRPDGQERLLDWVLAHPRTVYFGKIAGLLAFLIGVLLLLISSTSRAPGWLGLTVAALAALLPASELAVGLVNHLMTLLLPPRVLAKLELKEGVPQEFATFVVMPSMLVRPRSAEVLCERMETHYLANPGANLRFALLTDFADAPQEVMPADQALLDDALARVRALNQRYAPDAPDLFFLFHRRRMWNASEGCWMGWERKRGKLSEFNRLLRGDRGTTYMLASADPTSGTRTRFVITLDADTQMPRDTVRRLIGSLAHPLNQPRFDPGSGRVLEGYGVLQPRVSFHLTAATHSHFAALLAASGGIDPYSSAASDTYMDLFGLGSFIGKGIYDVDAFEAATGGTFPENHILSHDLVEGNYARCGLLSDTELFDDFPARYHAHAQGAPLGAGRLAASAMAGPARACSRRHARQPAASHRALEAAGQSASQPGSPRAAGDAGAGLDGAAGLSLALDIPGSGRAGSPRGEVGDRRRAGLCAHGFHGGPDGLAAACSAHRRAVPAGDRAACRPGAHHVRRRGAHVDPAAVHPAQAAGVGDGGVHRAAPGVRAAGFPLGHVGNAGDGRGVRAAGDAGAAAGPLGGEPVPGRMAAFSPRRLPGEPPEEAARSSARDRRAKGVATDHAQDLAFLRDFRGRRRSLAAA